jgi:hypothetical protein
MIFAALSSMMDMKTLYDIIEDSYLNPKTCTAPRRVLAYGVLFNIFAESPVAPWIGINKMNLTEYVWIIAVSDRLAATALITLDMLPWVGLLIFARHNFINLRQPQPKHT